MRILLNKWWNKGNKNFSVISYKRVWDKPIFNYRSNGARKGIDKCLDISLTFGYIVFNYTNFNY